MTKLEMFTALINLDYELGIRHQADKTDATDKLWEHIKAALAEMPTYDDPLDGGKAEK